MAGTGVSAPGWARTSGVDASDKLDRQAAVDSRFAWLSLLFAGWILGGLLVIIWAFNRGLLPDVAVSAYHIPFYLALAVLAAVSGWLVVRTVRAGRPWHRAFPPGYGGVGAGLLVLLAWPFIDLGWREGIGIEGPGIGEFFAPSRLLLPIGIGLIGAAPLRAGLRSPRVRAGRWPTVFSAALLLALIGGSAGFGAASSQRLEAAPNGPEDDAEIWAMNLDGSAQTRLIESGDGFDVGAPAWSPDGTQFAYTRSRSPAQQDVFAEDVDIWIASADGANRRPLVEGVGWQWLPHFSPDGQWLVYTVDGPYGPGGRAGLSAPFFGWLQGPAAGQPASVTPEVDVWRVRVDGTGQPERLTDAPADDRAGVYSPDGRHLLFDSTREGGRPGIYVMDADRSNIVRVTFFGDDWGGTWSPDGTLIAFNSEQGNRPEHIYLVEIPGSGPPVKLTDAPEPAGDLRPCFSPDGARIAFDSSRDREQEIWSVAVDGSDLRNLTRTHGVSEGLAPGGGCWGPDGRILYQRSGAHAASSSQLVREDFAVLEVLFQAILLSILVLVVVRLGAPFGAVALILGLSTVIWVIDNGQWRFVPGAIVGGFLVDVLIRLAPARLKAPIAGAGSAVALALAAGLTVLATTGLAWPPGMLLAVAIASGAIGWGLSGVIAPASRIEAQVASE
jgi:Tol biopolymer transport system component